MDYILQLGLNRDRKSYPTDPNVQVAWLIDQILGLIAENLLEDDDRGGFRLESKKLRLEIINCGGVQIPGPTALNTLNLFHDEFERSRSRRAKRDAHFAEIIVLLRKALADLAGDSKTFHDNLMGTSERIRELTQVKDIEELKLKVAAEVNELNRTVLEKHQREQVQFTQLAEQVTVLQRKLEAAKVEASIDGLTGIANRRNFDFTIQRWVLAHEKTEEPFTAAIFDIDDFKQINDSYGHQIGDKVLISAAMELGRHIRENDFLARYGGDEFVVLSGGVTLGESERRFSGLLKSFGDNTRESRGGESDPAAVIPTLSCGVAEYALGESAKDLIRRADQAMYDAKRQGKNRVVTKKRPLLGAFYEGRRRKA